MYDSSITVQLYLWGGGGGGGGGGGSTFYYISEPPCDQCRHQVYVMYACE